MVGRTIIGLCISALLAGAMAAQAVVAAPTGTTVFTCKKVETGAKFSDPHCKTAVGGGGEGYAHVSVAANTTTGLIGYNEITPGQWSVFKITSTVGAVPIEIQASTVEQGGQITNSLDSETGEHTANGTGGIKFKEAVVTKPSGSGCLLKTDIFPSKEVGAEEEFETRVLRVTTAKQEDALRFEPLEGSVLASFWLQGCKNGALNKTYDLTGSFKTSSITGPTITFTEAGTKAQNSLKLSGQLATIDGTLTVTGTDIEDTEDPFTPLSFTTVATP